MDRCQSPSGSPDARFRSKTDCEIRNIRYILAHDPASASLHNRFLRNRKGDSLLRLQAVHSGSIDISGA